MDLNLIITQLRQRCTTFDSRIAGAAQFKPIAEGTAMALPAAYVIPLDDNPEENRSPSGYQQKLKDGFAVVMVISNTVDVRGQDAKTSVDALRAEIWKALLAWQPTPDYDGVVYDGGNLLLMDRAYLYYQLEFSALTEISFEDTWQSVRDDELPFIEGVNINTDIQNPIPDGVMENAVKIDLPDH